MNLSDMQQAIEQLRNERWTYAKREETRREVDAILRIVDGLESALREVRAETAILRSRVEEMEAVELTRIEG